MNKTVLVLAPHTDDGELGCGGTISLFVKKNYEVWYVAFSACEESLDPQLPKDTLRRELISATAVLGIKEERVIIKNYKVRHFSEHRQEILDDLILIDKKIKPSVVFMPSLQDIHQDHITIVQEGIRAFKKKTIFTYELPWNNMMFENQVFFILDDDGVNQKVKALKQYKSQSGRLYTAEDNIRALLQTHGMQIGVKFAEVFEVPRLVIGEEDL